MVQSVEGASSPAANTTRRENRSIDIVVVADFPSLISWYRNSHPNIAPAFYEEIKGSTMQFPISIACPSCQAKLKIKEKSHLGRSIRCPKCGEKFKAEAPDFADVDEVDIAESDDAVQTLPPIRTKSKAAKSEPVRTSQPESRRNRDHPSVRTIPSCSSRSAVARLSLSELAAAFGF